MNLINDICNFLKNPNIAQLEGFKGEKNIFWRIFLFQLIFFLLYGIIWVILNTFGIKMPINNVRQDYFNIYGQYAYLFILLIGPLLEEILFRLPLLLQKRMIIISSGVPLFYLLALLFWNISRYRLLGILLLLFYFLFALNVSQSNLDHLRKKHYKKVIWGNVFIYTLLHLVNYDCFNYVNLLFLLPIFSAAILMTYLRCKLGFKYNVVFHIIFNFIAVII